VSALDELTKDAERQLATFDSELRRMASEVTDRVTSMVASLDAGQRVNRLGVLQQSAGEVDRLCALREAVADQLVQLRYLSEREAAAV
jgi:hypothetical protein